jgi:SH3/ankyrin repeat-containing protein
VSFHTPNRFPPNNLACSGSSSGSSSMPHSFSVEEIQKGKSLLKSSKSYPEDFLKKQNEVALATMEDGDNSSSGVSSDQEVPTGGETLTVQEHNSMTLPSPKTQRQHAGLLSRHAVSLAQLPPPIENDGDEKEEFCLPPPPEFGGGNGCADHHATEAVLAPPPQFSDNRQVTRVRIVGTVPKGVPAPVNNQAKLKQGRLHSQ